MLSTLQDISSDMAIVYDGACPVCSRFVTYSRLKAHDGDFQLINARDHEALQSHCLAEGINLDDGMVLWLHGEIYHGDEAMYRITQLTTSSSFLNKAVYLLNKSPMLARLSYPVLRAGRNTLLLLLGITKIHQ